MQTTSRLNLNDLITWEMFEQSFVELHKDNVVWCTQISHCCSYYTMTLRSTTTKIQFTTAMRYIFSASAITQISRLHSTYALLRHGPQQPFSTFPARRRYCL